MHTATTAPRNILRHAKMLTGLTFIVAVLGVPAAAQVGGVNFGAWNSVITPTTSAMHNSIAEAGAEANGYGMAVPPVGGGSGTTTIGGVPTFQFSGSDLPNNNQAGLGGVTGDNRAIALNANVWGDLHPPIDAYKLVQFAATIYHELAHIAYEEKYLEWCQDHPAACQSWKACIAALTDDDGTSKGYNVDDGRNPCDEGYAASTEYGKLCGDKQAICTNGDLSQADKDRLIAELDKAMSEAKDECEKGTHDCNECPGGPGMPAGFAGCPTSPCNCPQ